MAPTSQKTDAPGVGDIVLYRADKSTQWPVLVTSVSGDAISGQSFQSGTEVHAVTDIKPGKDVGQYQAK